MVTAPTKVAEDGYSPPHASITNGIAYSYLESIYIHLHLEIDQESYYNTVCCVAYFIYG